MKIKCQILNLKAKNDKPLNSAETLPKQHYYV